MSERLLLVGPAWIGDMVMAHSLVRMLAESESGPIIDLVAPPATASLGSRLPGVDRTFRLDAVHGQLAWRSRRNLARKLRGGYRQAIVLPNSFKSALVPWWARIPIRTGWLGEQRYLLLNDLRRLDEDRYPRMVDRFLALGLPSGAALPEHAPAPRLLADSMRAEALVKDFGLPADRPVLALCPGAEFGPAKRWPARHFAAVAGEYARRGGAVWLIGSLAERCLAADVLQALPAGATQHVHDLTGRTTVLDAIDLLSLAEQVVCNDSGLMHVAVALDRRVVAVYGSTSPRYTPPLDAGAEIVTLSLECSPCFQRECPLGHLRCLNDLGPEQVTERLKMPD
jgi:heptosyltransferase II